MRSYIEELQDEIETLNNSLEFIENGAGEHCEVAHILSAIKVEVKTLQDKIDNYEPVPVPYEPEFDKYDKLGW